MADPEHVVALDGTPLHVTTRGEGETYLLIQGLGYASWAWEPQLEGLSRHGRVVAFDNRGSGRSGKPTGPYSIRLLAEDARAVLTQVGEAPAHVVGCSMGGYIALTLALRFPALVRSLVLIATSDGGEGAHDVPEQTRSAWAAAATLPPEEFARRTMPLSFAPGWTDAHPDQFEALLQARLRHPTPAAAWEAQYAACQAYIRDGLGPGPIRQPTLVIHGTEDRVLPYRNAARLARRLADVRTRTLDGAGHLCWLEQPDAVNDAITRFTRGVAARGGATCDDGEARG